MAPPRKESSASLTAEIDAKDFSGSYSYLQNGIYGKDIDHGLDHAVNRPVDLPATSRGRGFDDLLRRLFSKEYVTVEHMPEQYKERFLVRGYRQAYSSLIDCVASTVRPNNETLNIWTHLVPFYILLTYFLLTFPGKLWPLTAIDNRLYPLLSAETSICAYLLCSSLAHLFNCMTPRIRHICFYFDYAAISMYGIGGACATFYYLRPLRSGFILLDSPNLFLFIGSFWSVLACYVNCASRHRWDGTKYVVRTLALFFPFIHGNIPVFYRFLECGLTGQECSYGLLYCFAAWSFYLISAVLNATRVPERFCPSTFDIVGHNHQWVHMMTTFGTVAFIYAVYNDLAERSEDLEDHLSQVTFMASIGWTTATITLTVALAVWSGTGLAPSGHLHTKEKNS